MSVLLKISKFSARYNNIKFIRVNSFATTGRKISKSMKGVKSTLPRTIVPPPASASIEEAWVEVVDKPSGSKYFWNTVTNETTELGAQKPTTGSNAAITAEANKGGSPMGGLGRVVAEGFAFGVGSSVAHGIVGSIFGGGSSGSNSSGTSDSTISDDWDI